MHPGHRGVHLLSINLNGPSAITKGMYEILFYSKLVLMYSKVDGYFDLRVKIDKKGDLRRKHSTLIWIIECIT